MAFMLLGTFSHLLDNAAALQCLGSIHAALKPGGKFVLELSHPTDVFDGSLLQEIEWDTTEDLPPADGIPGELAVQYGSPGDEFDPIDQVATRSCLAACVVVLEAISFDSINYPIACRLSCEQYRYMRGITAATCNTGLAKLSLSESIHFRK